MTLQEIVKHTIKQNPNTRDNNRYLTLEVWRKQGLELHPHQRDKILEDEVSSPESIAAAKRKVLREVMDEEQAARERTGQKRMPVKVIVP